MHANIDVILSFPLKNLGIIEYIGDIEVIVRRNKISVIGPFYEIRRLLTPYF
jgi:hypothetical protein